ncbi:MAG: hypothetical protein ACLUKN_10540 [Bacilli bacterium]
MKKLVRRDAEKPIGWENPDDFDGEDLQPSQNNQSDEQLKGTLF